MWIPDSFRTHDILLPQAYQEVQSISLSCMTETMFCWTEAPEHLLWGSKYLGACHLSSISHIYRLLITEFSSPNQSSAF